MDRRELYFYFEPFEVIPPKDLSCKLVEIIDYRWYYEHDKSRENSKNIIERYNLKYKISNPYSCK